MQCAADATLLIVLHLIPRYFTGIAVEAWNLAVSGLVVRAGLRPTTRVNDDAAGQRQTRGVAAQTVALLDPAPSSFPQPPKSARSGQTARLVRDDVIWERMNYLLPWSRGRYS